MKFKHLESPWITSGIKKSSKRTNKQTNKHKKKKRCLYQKFLKKVTEENESEYKNLKKLFKTVKKSSKQFFEINTKMSKQYQKTCNVVKGAIGKT